MIALEMKWDVSRFVARSKRIEWERIELRLIETQLSASSVCPIVNLRIVSLSPIGSDLNAIPNSFVTGKCQLRAAGNLSGSQIWGQTHNRAFIEWQGESTLTLIVLFSASLNSQLSEPTWNNVWPPILEAYTACYTQTHTIMCHHMCDIIERV